MFVSKWFDLNDSTHKIVEPTKLDSGIDKMNRY